VRSKRRPLVRYAVAASVLAVALGLGLFSGLNHPAIYTAEFSTALGERRHVALPDGSVIDLNSRSRVQVRYENDRRSIELTQGEAMFSVEHDTRRPFVVEAGSGKVTVTGTRFDVRRDTAQTRVVVEQGTVKVQGHAAADSDFISLTAGLGTHIDAQGKVAAAYAVNPAELTAWRSGKLVFTTPDSATSPRKFRAIGEAAHRRQRQSGQSAPDQRVQIRQHRRTAQGLAEHSAGGRAHPR
jgi:Fe2+-dicitrate sensor, membrane component